MCQRQYFLRIKEEVILKRRKKFDDLDYDQNILIPMHKKYIETTEKYSNMLIDVSINNLEQVYGKIKNDIEKTIPIELS